MIEAHTEDMLSAYLEGELDGLRKADIEAHLAACPECASLLEAMGDARDALASLPELEPSPDLLRRLYAIPERKKRFRPVRDFLLRPSLQPVFAGATGLMVFLSFLAFSPAGRSLQKSLNRQVHAGYGRIERLYVKAGSIPDEIGGRKESLLGSLRSVDILRKGGEKE
ncbi:MAG TPA: zf-HC2 domain-containing protein [Acidobacteriota bacterium]|nr:zf-HC2 domain-containing protein [Acidobacteriota bacterium]